MNKFVVFPYDDHLTEVINWIDKNIEDSIEDLLTMKGWGSCGSQVQIGDELIRVKSSINEISKECNSIWIVESYYDLDFFVHILPVLIYAKEKRWLVYYGRNFSKEEEGLIRKIIDEKYLIVLKQEYENNDVQNRLYDIKKPVIWIVDMFSGMPYKNTLFMLYDSFQQLGYSVNAITKRKDVPLLFEEIKVFPNVLGLNIQESVKNINHYLKEIERHESRDLFLIEIPGNLLEISKKIYGDYGTGAFIISKAVPPDIIICNIPYMDRVLENKVSLLAAVESSMGLVVDYLDMIPVYLDLLESEQMGSFEYITLTSDFVDSKLKNCPDIFNINSEEKARVLVELIIRQLNSYV